MLDEKEKLDFIDQIIGETDAVGSEDPEIPEQSDASSNKIQIEKLKTLAKSLETLNIGIRKKLWNDKEEVESKRSEIKSALEKLDEISNELGQKLEEVESARIELETSDIKNSIDSARNIFSENPRDKALYRVLTAILRIKWLSRPDDSVVRGFVARGTERIPFEFDTGEFPRGEIIKNIWGLLQEGNDFF